TGTAFALSDDAGAVLDRGAIGDSIGAPLGFAWVAPAGMLRPGDVVEFTVTTPAEAATRLRRELKVSSDMDGNFLRLELTGPDAAGVTGTVNAVASRFVAAAADLKRDNLTQLTGILGAQLAQAQARLRVGYTAEAPAVRRVAAEAATLERQTIPQLATGLARELERRAAELGQRADSVARDLRRIPPLAVEETRLQRDVTQSAQTVANL